MTNSNVPPPGIAPDSDAEFDAMLARIGHAIPPGRRAGLIASYADMKQQAAIVRRAALDAAIEPSNTFSLAGFRHGPDGSGA